MSLKNKVVVITGGSSGIGADAARGFLEAGAKVVINGRSEKKLASLAAQLDPTSQHITYLAGDIRNTETSNGLIDMAINKFGGLDILTDIPHPTQRKNYLNYMAFAIRRPCHEYRRTLQKLQPGPSWTCRRDG